MLLEFRVSNYKSIKTLETFSMVPSSTKSSENITVLNSGKINILPTAVLFGRNGAGKSNMFDALHKLQDIILHPEEKYILHPSYYLLAKEYKSLPTYFGVDFIAKDQIRYSYDIEFTKEGIVKEELNYYPKNQRANLYKRNDDRLSFGEYFVGAKSYLEKTLYHDQLVLSKVRHENIEVLKEPFTFFEKSLFYRKPGFLSNTGYLSHFAKNIFHSKYPKYRENLARLLRAADTGIIDIQAKRRELAEIQLSIDDADARKKAEKALEYYIITTHRCDGGEPDNKNFSIYQESTGTRMLLEIGGLMLESLHDGQTLIIDEFDSSLHPILTKELVKLFHSPKTNPNNAQLIISTQDVSLLNSSLFDFDQMWIVEKTYEGFSEYYSLSDIKGLRKNIPLEKWYLEGRLGGVPVINYSELEFDII